jgi:hypothetical protein
MKLSENVEVESNEAKASNSRASRMARYSAAAAGVAAVSALDVDAAMIKVIVTDAQNVTNFYTLNLNGIKSGASFTMSMSSSSPGSGSFFTYSYAGTDLATSFGSRLKPFKSGNKIGSSDFPSLPQSGYRFMNSGNEGLFGFRVDQGGGAYTYGWFKVYIDSASAFTLSSYGYNSTLNEVAIAGQGSVAGVPDSGPGIVGLALIGAGAAGVRLLRKLRAGN